MKSKINLAIEVCSMALKESINNNEQLADILSSRGLAYMENDNLEKGITFNI